MKHPFSKSTVLAVTLACLPAHNAFAVSVSEPQLLINGVIEIDAFSTSQDVTAESSDIVLSTAEIDVQARINTQVSADIILLYEEGMSGLDVDEAFLSIQLNEQTMLTGGKMVVPFGEYASNMLSDPLTLSVVSPSDSVSGSESMVVPFGEYASNMLSDPLTLSLGETTDSALHLLYSSAQWSSAVYLFNGDIEENSAIDDDELRIGARLSYNSEGFSAGIDWISSLDSNALDELVATNTATTEANIVSKTVAAAGFHVSWQWDRLQLHAEHIMATDDFIADDFGSNVTSTVQPTASTLELGYTLGNDDIVAISVQQSSDAAFLGFAEQVVQLAYNTTLVDGVALGVEYTASTDYSTAEGGADDDGSQILLRLGAEF